MRWIWIALALLVSLSANAQSEGDWYYRWFGGASGTLSATNWTKKSIAPGEVSRFTWTTNNDPTTALVALACPATVFTYHPDVDLTSGNTAARGMIYSCASENTAITDCAPVIELRKNATINQAWNKPGIWRLDVTAAPGSGTAQVSAFCDPNPTRVPQAWPEILHETITAASGAWFRKIPRNPNRLGLVVFNQNPGADASFPLFIFTTGGGMGASDISDTSCNTSTNVGIQVDPGEMFELETTGGWDVITCIGSSNPTNAINYRVIEVLTVHGPASAFSPGDYSANGDE